LIGFLAIRYTGKIYDPKIRVPMAQRVAFAFRLSPSTNIQIANPEFKSTYHLSIVLPYTSFLIFPLWLIISGINSKISKDHAKSGKLANLFEINE